MSVSVKLLVKRLAIKHLYDASCYGKMLKMTKKITIFFNFFKHGQRSAMRGLARVTARCLSIAFSQGGFYASVPSTGRLRERVGHGAAYAAWSVSRP